MPKNEITLKKVEGYKIVYILKDLFDGRSYECPTEEKAIEIMKEKNLDYHYIVPVYVKERNL